MLESLIDEARRRGASDLHLEPGVPMTLRVRGKLVASGEPLPRATLEQLARDLLGDDWEGFVARRSFDLSRTVRGVRCRLNVLTSLRGVGLAVRLLPSARPSLERLNLHPELRRFAEAQHGLVIVSGPTGCGKSSTVAALVEELNASEPRHIITLEEPVEHVYRPRRALIRQREVGRDTPSFEQGLIDALREDPDVIVVGELREPATMRLALNAAETGHLVLTTLHSSSAPEALQRLVMAFPAEIQGGVASQLGDCLVGVICQRLRYRADVDLRIPECEVLWATSGVRGLVRQSGFSRLPSAIEGGGADGMFTFGRYAAWVDKRKDWHRPEAEPAVEGDGLDHDRAPMLASEAARARGATAGAAPSPAFAHRGPTAGSHPAPPRAAAAAHSGAEAPAPRHAAANRPNTTNRPSGAPRPSATTWPSASNRPNAAAEPVDDEAQSLEIGESEQSLAEVLRELERRGKR